MYLTLSEIKQHLNIESDFTLDDGYLSALGMVVEDAVEKHIDNSLSNLAVNGQLPAALKHAMLLLLGNYYLNRENVAFTGVNEIPTSYHYLLDLYKNYNSSSDIYGLISSLQEKFNQLLTAHEQDVYKLKQQDSLLTVTDSVHTTEINKLKDSDTEHKTEIDSLKTANTTNTEEINKLKDSDTEHKAEIDNLKTANTTHSTDINKLKNSDSTHTADINKLKSSDTEHKAEIDSLKAANTTHSADINKLKDADTNINQNITKINNTITKIEEQLNNGQIEFDGTIDCGEY